MQDSNTLGPDLAYMTELALEIHTCIVPLPSSMFHCTYRYAHSNMQMGAKTANVTDQEFSSVLTARTCADDLHGDTSKHGCCNHLMATQDTHAHTAPNYKTSMLLMCSM